MARRAEHLAALACLLLACESSTRPLNEVEGGVPETPYRFLDASPLPDGTAVRADGTLPLADENDDNCPRGSVTGLVCAPNAQQTPIVGATVEASTFDCDGRPVVVEGQSARNGQFRVDGLAPGATEIRVIAGSFIARYEVEVRADTAVPLGDVSDKVCLPATAASLAVLSGDFDEVETILFELGFNPQIFCGDTRNHRAGRALLQDAERLAGYDIVFFNCATGINLRATNPETERAAENLKAFVDRGGAVYVSDLSADIVEAVWPGAITFDYEGRARPGAPEDPCCVCGAECPAECLEVEAPPEICRHCCDEALPTAAGCGRGLPVNGRGQSGRRTGVVVDSALRTWMDDDRFEVNFALPLWVGIESVGADTRVLVRDEGGRPLVVAFQPPGARGRVVYTSFHLHDQATETTRRLLAALVFQL
jgi:hypothetical protein